MLKVHHLELSRADRSVWMVEELGIAYELIRHKRDAETFRAPQSLWDVSPMGKVPVIQDGDITVYESGAVIEYLIDEYGHGRFRPQRRSAEYRAYQQWMHAAESTLMVPILTEVLCKLTQTEAPSLQQFLDGEYLTTLKHLDDTLSKSDYVAGDAFTGADVMVAYSYQLANGTSIPGMATSAPIEQFPNVMAYLQRIDARPAYQRARKLCSEEA